MGKMKLVLATLFFVAQAVANEETPVRDPAANRMSASVAVDAKQKHINLQIGNKATQIPLVIPEDMSLEGKPQIFGGDGFWLIQASMASDELGTTIYYAVDNNGNKLWTLDTEAFNPSSPLIEKDHVYLAGMGQVYKLDKKSGAVVWRLKDLYQKYEFNGGEPISRKGDVISFSAKIQVNDKTGKIVGGK